MKLHLRVNTLLSNTQHVLAELKNAGWETDICHWCPQAITVNVSVPLDEMEGQRQRLTECEAYRQGFFLLQNHSSLLPCLALAVEPDLDILDMCAAPGGKTTYLAALADNQARIVANDISKDRIFRLRALAQKLGAKDIRTLCGPGHLMWQRHFESFDRVLLDAPCSMHGTTTPSGSEIRSLAKRQKFLLKSALGCTRVGGLIVYSTCTIHREENESVVAWLLKQHPNEFEVLDPDLPGAPWQPPLEVDHKGREYPGPVRNCRRIAPDPVTGMEGFFVTKIRKLVSQRPGEPTKDRPRSAHWRAKR